MRTISLVASSRPVYTAEALSGLTLALLTLAESGRRGFDKLIMSIDVDSFGNVEPGTEKLCEKAAEIISNEGLAECFIYVNQSREGVGGNHHAALSRAFEEHESDFNVLIEDDAKLTLDSLHFANWFQERHGGPLSDYVLASLCNHRGFGHGQNPGEIPDDPSFVVESPFITAPFAWALSKHQWPFVKATWCTKFLGPNGWDFSLSYNMRLARKKSLHPVVSRCQNIGEIGMHETPASFAKTQKDLIISDGTYAGGFRVVGKLPHEELMKIDDWMASEYWRWFPK
jgi:hypothetical protein